MGAGPTGHHLDRLQSAGRARNARPAPLSGALAADLQREDIAGNRLAHDHGGLQLGQSLCGRRGQGRLRHRDPCLAHHHEADARQRAPGQAKRLRPSSTGARGFAVADELLPSTSVTVRLAERVTIPGAT